MNDHIWANPLAIGIALGLLGGALRILGWLVQRAVARHDSLVHDVEAVSKRVRQMELEIELAFPDVRFRWQEHHLPDRLRAGVHDAQGE